MLFTVVFIAFEQLARCGVEHWGMHEFCWMAISFIGFAWLIRWRGTSRAGPDAVAEPGGLPRPVWRGIGGNA